MYTWTVIRYSGEGEIVQSINLGPWLSKMGRKYAAIYCLDNKSRRYTFYIS